MNTLARIAAGAVAIAIAAFPQSAAACAACMGDPNTKLAGASNGMMFFLLGILASVFAMIGAFAFIIIRQARAPLPPPAEFGDTTHS